eukprot:sb/3473697/
MDGSIDCCSKHHVLTVKIIGIFPPIAVVLLVTYTHVCAVTESSGTPDPSFNLERFITVEFTFPPPPHWPSTPSCALGLFHDKTRDECVSVCPKGTYVEGKECIDCQPGYSQDRERQTGKRRIVIRGIRDHVRFNELGTNLQKRTRVW